MRALVESMGDDHPGRAAVVLSNNADSAGIAWARAQGIATEVVDHRPHGQNRAAFEAEIMDRLAPYTLDVICLAGFMRVLTAGFVEAWAGRMLNIHPSLLPKYPGLHTHARALEAGDSEHGCTVHVVTSVLDDGPILGQRRIPILPDDTPDRLAARVLVEEHRLYPAVLQRFLVGEGSPINC